MGAAIPVGCVGEPLPEGTEFDDAESYNVQTYVGDMQSKVGNPVATGNTSTFSNDFAPSCANSNARDASYTWTVPVSGSYTFDTFGSSFDTVLHLRKYNNSAETLVATMMLLERFNHRKHSP